jgi:hypothetical protein
MTSAATVRRQPPQFDELEAERLEVGDVAVQGCPVDHRTHQQGVRAGLHPLERLQRRGQHRRNTAGDPEGVVSAHVGFPSPKIACTPIIGASG